MPDLGTTPRSFSPHCDRFFDAIRPYGPTGRQVFPPKSTELDSKRNRGETLHSWFCRVVNQLGPQAPDSLAVESNMGILATLRWISGTVLSYANIQVIVATCALEEFYCDPNQTAFYLRFDCDAKTLGNPFSHPHSQLHVDGELSPRFVLDGGTTENVLVDFIEFLYRHYFPDLWWEWASSIWNRDYAERHSDQPDQNPLPKIFEAFQLSQLNVLSDYKSDLAHLKRLLTEAKQRFSSLRMHATDRELLEYPLAR